jgi:hypothetical protein
LYRRHLNYRDGKTQSSEHRECVFNKLIIGIFDHAKFAEKQRISIHPDAYFFLIDKAGVNIDFVVGDLDNVSKIINDSSTKGNLFNALGSVNDFLYKNVEKPDKYLTVARDMYCKISNAERHEDIATLKT